MNAYQVALRTILAIPSWHITSVEVARRNALVASTELAQRRLERREAEEFLATLRAPAQMSAPQQVVTG